MKRPFLVFLYLHDIDGDSIGECVRLELDYLGSGDLKTGDGLDVF